MPVKWLNATQIRRQLIVMLLSQCAWIYQRLALHMHISAREDAVDFNLA